MSSFCPPGAPPYPLGPTFCPPNSHHPDPSHLVPPLPSSPPPILHQPSPRFSASLRSAKSPPWSPIPTLLALTSCPPHSHKPYPTHLSPPLPNRLISVCTIRPPGGDPDQVTQNSHQMALFSSLNHRNSNLHKSATGGRPRPSNQNTPPEGTHSMKAVVNNNLRFAADCVYEGDY